MHSPSFPVVLGGQMWVPAPMVKRVEDVLYPVTILRDKYSKDWSEQWCLCPGEKQEYFNLRHQHLIGSKTGIHLITKMPQEWTIWIMLHPVSDNFVTDLLEL